MSVVHPKYTGIVLVMQCQVVTHSMGSELTRTYPVGFNFPPVAVIHMVLVAVHIQEGIKPIILIIHNVRR